MKIVETERVVLREMTAEDAEFVLDLLNQPSFIKYIGDRKVRSPEAARDFIENRYRASYRDHGFGLYTVELREEAEKPKSNSETENRRPKTKIGICGFVKRDYLPAPDIGFAFLPAFEGKGYAFEAASAAMTYGREALGFTRVLAITTLDNHSSGRLLGRLGFRYDGEIENENEKLKLYSAEMKSSAGEPKMNTD